MRDAEKLKLKTFNRSYTTYELLLKNKLFKSSVDAQRVTEKWDIESLVKLMESIYLNYPIPPIYVSKEGNDYKFIDGQHRLQALEDIKNNFVDNKSNDKNYLDIYMDRLDISFRDFLNNDKMFEEFTSRFIRYEWLVVEIKHDNSLDSQIIAATIFDILNSTRKPLASGDNIRGKLVLGGISKSELMIIEKHMKELNYSKAALVNSKHLNDYIISLAISELESEELSKMKKISDIISNFFSKKNNVKKVVDKTLPVLEKFTKYVQEKNIYLNSRLKKGKSQSTFIYPALSEFFRKSKLVKNHYVELVEGIKKRVDDPNTRNDVYTPLAKIKISRLYFTMKEKNKNGNFENLFNK